MLYRGSLNRGSTVIVILKKCGIVGLASLVKCLQEVDSQKSSGNFNTTTSATATGTVAYSTTMTMIATATATIP